MMTSDCTAMDLGPQAAGLLFFPAMGRKPSWRSGRPESLLSRIYNIWRYVMSDAHMRALSDTFGLSE